MRSAIFVCEIVNGSPVLPPMAMSADSGFAYALGAGDGSGWVVVGNMPQAQTCLVRVTSSPATIDAMIADARFVYIEDV
jgi:hypothetical protein